MKHKLGLKQNISILIEQFLCCMKKDKYVIFASYLKSAQHNICIHSSQKGILQMLILFRSPMYNHQRGSPHASLRVNCFAPSIPNIQMSRKFNIRSDFFWVVALLQNLIYDNTIFITITGNMAMMGILRQTRNNTTFLMRNHLENQGYTSGF